MRMVGTRRAVVLATLAAALLPSVGCQRAIFEKWDVDRQCYEFFKGRVPGQKGRPVCDHMADGFTYYVDGEGNCWTGTWCDLETAWGFEPADFEYLEQHCGPLYYEEYSPFCSELDEGSE